MIADINQTVFPTVGVNGDRVSVVLGQLASFTCDPAAARRFGADLIAMANLIDARTKKAGAETKAEEA